MRKKLRILSVLLFVLLLLFSTITVSALEPIEKAKLYLELKKFNRKTVEIEDINLQINRLIESGINYDLIMDYIKNTDYDILKQNIKKAAVVLENNTNPEKINSALKNNNFNEEFLLGFLNIKPEVRDVSLNVVKISNKDIEVMIKTEKNIDNSFNVNIEGDKLNKIKRAKKGEKTIFTDLDADTIYKLFLTNKEDLVLEKIYIKTFKNSGQDLELFYLIDASDPSKQQLKIDIFGYNNDRNDLVLNRRSLQFRDKFPILVEDKTTKTRNVDLNYNKEIEAIVKDNGFFKISYLVDKSNANREAGYFDEDYLMTTVDQILIFPFNKIDEHFYEEEVDMEIKGFLNIPSVWKYDLGFKVENKIIDFIDGAAKAHYESAQIFAFKDYDFQVIKKNILGTDVKVILENSLNHDYEYIFDVYQYLAELWGDKPSYNENDKYTVMLVDSYANIYGGEHDTHQGYSPNKHGKYSNMLPHQMYHRWQGWDRGVEWDWSRDKHGGFWVEGFTDYYSWKVYQDLDFRQGDTPGYDWYKSIRGTNKDIPILEFEDDEYDWRIIYTKGAVLAYALDQKIRDLSEGEYSLANLLKYTWSRYNNKKYKLNYEIILSYLTNDLELTGIESWWEKHIINNEPVYIEQWE
jgi:hypothetical protein